MNRRRAIIGLCTVCALLVSAFAAQGASAVPTKGTTVFTCTSSATKLDFKTEHCVPGQSGTAFGHVPVAEKTTTHFTATNEKTNAETNGPTQSKLKSTVSGLAVELVATGVHATGGIENTKDESGEHYVHGHNIVIKYTGVTEKLLGCTVTCIPGGVGTVETKKLTATTTGEGDFIKFTPEEGTVFAEFELSACATPAKVKVVGSLTCVPSGATITCNHKEVTEQGKLRLGNAEFGPPAGYEGTVTVTASHKEEGEGTTKPLSVTTVETP